MTPGNSSSNAALIALDAARADPDTGCGAFKHGLSPESEKLGGSATCMCAYLNCGLNQSRIFDEAPKILFVQVGTHDALDGFL